MRPASEESVAAAVTAAWHDEWARLLSLLVLRFRRLDLAEDALSAAFEAAVRTWPESGVPRAPAAWLLTAARRRGADLLRAEATAERALPDLAVDAIAADAAPPRPEDSLDVRLRLVLLCGNPRLRPADAAALSLRIVLGVPTEDVARLFLVRTSTMAARLTRAKKRLDGVPFALPEGDELASRVTHAADVAHLAFTAGYLPGSGPEVLRADVAAEAIRLARLLRELAGGAPPGVRRELDALLALMLLQHSRRRARVDGGRLVLLADQDRRDWRHDEIAAALELLTPHVLAPPSTYLLQALIAAEHAVARRAEDTDWARIVARYAELEAVAATPVVRLNRAVAVAESEGPAAGLALLDGLDLPGHRLPAVRAELHARAGRTADALRWYDAALTLCDNDAEEELLRRGRAALE